jgi:hypothetical protein
MSSESVDEDRDPTPICTDDEGNEYVNHESMVFVSGQGPSMGRPELSEEALSEEALSEEALSEEALSEEALSEEELSEEADPSKRFQRKRRPLEALSDRPLEALSEKAHHLMMVEGDSKGSATTRNHKDGQLWNHKADQLTKLWKAYALGRGPEHEESFQGEEGGILVALDEDSDPTPPPNNEATKRPRTAPKQKAPVFSPISVGDLQDLGTVLRISEPLQDQSRYWSDAFFRCQDGLGVGKLTWTGGRRRREVMIEQKTLLGIMEQQEFFVEDAAVFIRQGDPVFGRWFSDTNMALFGEAVARSSLVSGKKKVRSVWMDTFVYDQLLFKCCRQMDQKGGGNAVWEQFGKRFKGDKKGIGTCGMIFFPINRNCQWTLLAGNTVTRAWTWFDGYEPDPTATPSRRHPNPKNWRKSGLQADRLIKNFAHQLSYVMNRAAIEYPDIKGYQKFQGDWTLDTVHADKIPVQTDSWSCGQRVLLLADMLASGYNVRDMLDMYSDDDMPAIHQEMGHYALGLMQDATPMTQVGAQWVTSSSR